MAQIVTATDGTNLDLDSLPHTFTWSGGVLVQDLVVHPNGNSYAQQMTYSGSVLQTVSAWMLAS